jgi:hypothetical protein
MTNDERVLSLGWNLVKLRVLVDAVVLLQQPLVRRAGEALGSRVKQTKQANKSAVEYST